MEEVSDSATVGFLNHNIFGIRGAHRFHRLLDRDTCENDRVADCCLPNEFGTGATVIEVYLRGGEPGSELARFFYMRMMLGYSGGHRAASRNLSSSFEFQAKLGDNAG